VFNERYLDICKSLDAGLLVVIRCMFQALLKA